MDEAFSLDHSGTDEDAGAGARRGRPTIGVQGFGGLGFRVWGLGFGV